MKKRNTIYVLALIAIGAIIGLVPAALLAMSWQNNNIHDPNISGLVVVFVIFAVIAYAVIFTVIKDEIWSSSVKNLKHRFGQLDFAPNASFESSNGMLYIDEVNNKVGVITKFNPFELQIIDMGRVQNAWADTGMVILGATSLVRFCFTIDGQTWRIPTFTSRRNVSLTDKNVVAAMQTAELFARMLNRG